MLDDERGRGGRDEERPADDATTLRGSAAEERRADEEHLRALARARRARVAKVAVALAIVVILVVFVIANAKPVPVSFVFVTRHPELIWVMIACAVLGGIVGYLIGRPGRQVRFHRGDPGRRTDEPRRDSREP